MEKNVINLKKTKCVFPMFGGQEKFNCPTARKWIICALPDSFGYQISTCNSNLLLLTIAPSLVSRNNQMYLAGWVAKQCKTLCPAIFTPRRKQDTWHQNIAAPGRKLSNSREDRKGSMGLRELGCAQWGAWLGKPTQKSCYSFFCVYNSELHTDQRTNGPFQKNAYIASDWHFFERTNTWKTHLVPLLPYGNDINLIQTTDSEDPGDAFWTLS